MTVIEKLNSINNIIKELFEFVSSSDKTKSDFQEYLSTLGMLNPSPAQMEKIFIPYVFERNLGTPQKSVIEIFNKYGKPSDKEIAKSLLNAQYSVFRVEKILKNGFELFNLTNEKQYTVLSLTKMTNFRGVGIGEFMVARIFKLNDEYFLIGIDNMLPQSRIKDAIRYAVLKIVQNPWLVYQDNKEKEKKIKKDIKIIAQRFNEIFKTDEFITTNRYADTVIGMLNEEDLIEDFDIKEAQKLPDSYKFFVVKELNNGYDNFIENSLGGFASHEELYDVGIIIDEELGLYSIPFYKTFCMVFEDDTKVEDAKGCINYFLNNDSISDKILLRVAGKYPNFIDKINETLQENYTIDTLLDTYKQQFKKHKIYSSTSVLYHSTVFSRSIDLVEQAEKEQEKINNQKLSQTVLNKKIGRNDPCPCGSGKKYKNCCLKLKV